MIRRRRNRSLLEMESESNNRNREVTARAIASISRIVYLVHFFFLNKIYIFEIRVYKEKLNPIGLGIMPCAKMRTRVE